MLLHFQRKALTLVFNSIHSRFQPSFQISVSLCVIFNSVSSCGQVMCPISIPISQLCDFFYYVVLEIYLLLLSYLKRYRCVAFIWDTSYFLSPSNITLIAIVCWVVFSLSLMDGCGTYLALTLCYPASL